MQNKCKMVIFVCILMLTVQGAKIKSKSKSKSESKTSQYLIGSTAYLISLLRNQTQSEAEGLQTEIDYIKSGGVVRNATQDAICEALWKQQNSTWDLIHSLEDQINATNSSITDLHCENSDLYIASLKEHKVALELFAYLKEQIEQFNPSLLQMQKGGLSGTFAQLFALLQTSKKQVGIDEFAAILQSYEVDQTKERTAEEIGTGHIDNTQDALNVANFDSSSVEALSSIRTKMLSLLDDLIAGTQQAMEDAKNNQIASSIAAAEYRREKENELRVLLRSLHNAYDTMNQQQSVLDIQCPAHEDPAVIAQRMLDLQNQLTAQLAIVTQELALFDTLLQQFEAGVDSVDQKYKDYVDDWDEDKVFQTTTEFEARYLDGWADWHNLESTFDALPPQDYSQVPV